MPGRVWLVGAGPGQPSLLTQRAAEVIGEAQVVRHVAECDAAILRLAKTSADVGPYRDAEEVVQLATEGCRVAVLYPGDPYAFGDGAALAQCLERAGQDFDVVPGVLLETAAPALSGVPLTLEGRSASILLGIGRGDSVVVRLPPGWWESGIQALVDAGHDPESPAALITHPGLIAQRRVNGRLDEVAEVARRSGMDGEAVLVLGAGVRLGDRLDTGARRPLHGRRILVTRARHQVTELRRELSLLGATVLEAPTIEIRPLPRGQRFKTAVERLAATKLVVFTTANAVDVFFEGLYTFGRDARHLHGCRVCAIGQETARAVEARGIRPELVAGEYSAKSLDEALAGWDLERARVLVPRAEGTRDALRALLARRGAIVDLLPVYRTVRPAGCRETILGLAASGGLHAVTFTSSSTAINFVSAFPGDEITEVLDGTRVACMGPVTADTVRRLGVRVDIVASEYTTRGLASAIVEALA